MFFIILLPFATFAGLSFVTSVALSLSAAILVTLGLLARDCVSGRSAKAINLATVMIYGGFALGMALTGRDIGATTVRMVLDAGLLLMVLGSIALRAPFTLQYSREGVAPDVAVRPQFIRVNTVLSWAWAAAFTLMLAADVLALWLPSAPLWVGLVATFAVRNSAIQFTKWYTGRARDLFSAAPV